MAGSDGVKRDKAGKLVKGTARPAGAGMQKGTMTFGTLMELALAELSQPHKDAYGRERVISGKEMMVRVAIRKALKGEDRAIENIMDRIDGKAMQTVRNMGDGHGGLNIRITRSAEDIDDADDENVDYGGKDEGQEQ
jgi:hypothetical protein